MVHVIKNIKRPALGVVKAVAEFPPATLHEAQGRRGALNWRIKPIADGMRFCGPALTVRCTPGDNLMLAAAISIAQSGDVIVVDAGDSPEQGPFGEVLATAAKARGVAGMVFNCAIRDAAAIRKLGLAVFSTGVSIKGTVKETLGDVNHPVMVGGVHIEPGDILVGDDDGVVLVRAADADTVARASREREDKESRFMERLRAGENVTEVLGMDRVLAAKGCTWEP
ncbi:MAG: demethylmenaquinone methyltransferase family protein [Herminiimonas sp.]|nr:demethylmenaquinone methyltransferase family protein [Herminiimonas sp.]